MNDPLRTDGELLAEFAEAGSESAFAELMARHGAMAYGVALRVLADHHESQDVAQAAFCTLARKAHSIRKDASVGGWLHRVAWCLAVDVKSSRASRQRREEATMQAQADTVRDVAGEQGFREALDAALNQLPERYRQPLVLFHIEGNSLDATARMLGLKPGTVGSQLTRAREMLRAKLMRRGVAVASAGTLTTLLSAEAGAAVIPASFVSATVKAAGLAAAGKLAAGVTAGTVSANVAALTKGAVQMMLVAKMKTVAAAVVAPRQDCPGGRSRNGSAPPGQSVVLPQSSTTRPGMSAKSRALSVARIRPCLYAVAAIIMSRAGRGEPCRRMLTTRPAKASATPSSNASTGYWFSSSSL